MKTVQLPSGEPLPALGLGTWRMGEDRARRAEEIATIQLALDMNLTVIDTAEMYGSGRAEELIGEALAERRGRAFLVSKVYPHNASRTGLVQACERSLRRLRTDRIDLYLLHWRGEIPFDETLDAFVSLQRSGKIRHYGVSNLDRKDLEELWKAPHGSHIAINQLLYNLTRRGIELDILPWLRERHIPVMAYSPIEQGRLIQNQKLAQFAAQQGTTPAQAALAWVLAEKDVVAIPKTSNRSRLKENAEALHHPLTDEQLAELNRLFPPPPSPGPLEML